MNQLVKEGKVRVKGLSAYSEQDFEEIVPVVQPEALQSWAHALDDRFVRPGSRLVKLMENHDLTFVAFSPLAQGALLDKYDPAKPPTFEAGDNRKDSGAFTAERLTLLKPKLEKLKARFGSGTEALAATALNYILAQPRVACVIPGFRNERQAQCNLEATRHTLSPEDVQFIRQTLA